MPYRAPHTVAPALWALRHRDGCDFEASIAAAKGDTPWLKALEATAITLYRLDAGESPYLNFGRMPQGYRISTSNDRRLIESGRRAHGGPDPSALAPMPSVPVNGNPTTAPDSSTWLGWSWSQRVPLREAIRSPAGIGLYRIQNGPWPFLTYIGQGNIRDRLAAHLRKGNNPDHKQAPYFLESATASSVALPNIPTVNLLEHENDLIAAHVLATGTQPPAQFLG